MILNKEATKQLNNLVSILHQINDVDYTLSVPILKSSSVGKHVRHIVEFYQCLLFAQNNEVNYDNRKRNMLLEENVKYTIDFITEIIDELEKNESNYRLQLTTQYAGESVTIESNLYREIIYNIEHCVHHLAIISMAIPTNFSYINLPNNFGYADSTIKFLQTQKA